MKQLSIPNVITAMRIVGAVCLLFTEPFSLAFFIIYTLCGFSDILDGWIARKTQTTSEYGAKLDSAADIIFYSIFAFLIFPVLIRELPMGLWYAAYAVVAVRIVCYIIVAVKFKRFSSMHTYMNKATSATIFVMPYFMANSATTLICSILAVISGTATLEELVIQLRSDKYRSDVKSIIHMNKKADVSV